MTFQIQTPFQMEISKMGEIILSEHLNNTWISIKHFSNTELATADRKLNEHFENRIILKKYLREDMYYT